MDNSQKPNDDAGGKVMAGLGGLVGLGLGVMIMIYGWNQLSSNLVKMGMVFCFAGGMALWFAFLPAE